jgi:hypothetical protein
MKKPAEISIKQSARRATIGTITPGMAAIAIGWQSRCLHLIAYLDRVPNEDDNEAVSDMAGEIISDFPDYFLKTKEECRLFNQQNSQSNEQLECFILLK